VPKLNISEKDEGKEEKDVLTSNKFGIQKPRYCSIG
jgi:hypothetical protein